VPFRKQRPRLGLEGIAALDAPFRPRANWHHLQPSVGFERRRHVARVGALVVVALQIGDQDHEALARRQGQVPLADQAGESARRQPILDDLAKVIAEERANAQDPSESYDHRPRCPLVHAATLCIEMRSHCATVGSWLQPNRAGGYSPGTSRVIVAP